VADIWAARTGHEVRLVSANDHIHSRSSAHYEGLAVDLHSSAPDALAEAMRQAGFTVLWRVPGHFNHLHVEVRGQDAARTLGIQPPPAAPRRRATGGE
jgi:D-alanyl-D-alanine dipeptidase